MSVSSNSANGTDDVLWLWLYLCHYYDTDMRPRDSQSRKHRILLFFLRWEHCGIIPFLQTFFDLTKVTGLFLPFIISPSLSLSYFHLMLCVWPLFTWLSFFYPYCHLLPPSSNIHSIHCPAYPVLTLLELHLFVSHPLSIHVKVSCLLWHFCLFLCICLTPYCCFMYLSHFQSSAVKAFPGN